MATPGGRTDPPLERRLFEEPYQFDFFQAVRLLARLHHDRIPVGNEGPPGREVARFLAQLSLDFPASAITELGRSADPDAPPAMVVSFLGLTGPSGVLPHVFTEWLLEREREGEATTAAFLDIFNHRLVSLFYRAWEKHHPFVARERGEDDRLTACLFDLIGLGSPSLRDRHEFPDAAPLWHAGSFARRHRPAVVLEGLLRDYFGLPIEVQQFQGHWLRLGPDDRSTIGTPGANNALGISLVLGARVWDEQGMFRLRIGPLSFDQFRSLLPDGPVFRPLAQMARLLVNAEFDFDVQLVLKADEVPECRLTSAPGQCSRLGRYAWLKGRPFARDPDQAVFPAEF